MQVPDAPIEMNESHIPQSDPQSAIRLGRNDIPHPVWRSPLRQWKVSEARSTLSPDACAAAPPGVAIRRVKGAGHLFARAFLMDSLPDNVQQWQVRARARPERTVSSRHQCHFHIPVRQAHWYNVIVAEFQESVGTANPYVSLAILEELICESAGKAVLFTERFQFRIMTTVPAAPQLLGISDAYYSRPVHPRDP